MMRPNRPRTELKISMTRILTNLDMDQNGHGADALVDQNIHGGVSSVSQSSTTAVDADSDTTDEVA